MKISVACCVYNGADFLDMQLRSLVAQTVQPHEIVIVDDASSDRSVAIAEAFARDMRPMLEVRVKRNVANQGVAANFEKAIGLTTGDLVFLCDQDDVWHRSRVEKVCAQFAARPDLSLLHSDARLIGDDGGALGCSLFEALEFGRRERSLVREGSAFRALLVRNLVTGATAAFRRSVFHAARPFPRHWIHDEWLAIIAATTGRVDFLDEALIDYRQHSANQIGMRKLRWSDKLQRLSVSRGSRFTAFQLRAEVLLARLQAMGDDVPHALLGLVAEKCAHARVRASLPPNRAARLWPIAKEVATGRYSRYSSGFQGVVRDCLEPA